MTRYTLSALLLLAVIWAGCSGSRNLSALQPVVTHVAMISTSMGNIEVELYGNDAPKTVENFVGLANKGYYNGILFHRVQPGFVIQGGDPLSKDMTKRAEWGNGGESIYGPTFADELNESTPSYQRGYVEGTLAMANRGANTNNSQFFIILKDNEDLPHNYTIFGRVRSGMEVVRNIEKTELVDVSENRGGKPKTNVVMNRVTAFAAPTVTHTVVMTVAKGDSVMGDITMELYGQDAPMTVANFAGLSNQGFYNGILFHRVEPGFVIQGGDPQTKDPSKRSLWGTGGGSIYDNKKFADELNKNAPSSRLGYVEGTLAMANSGPNTNSSQFFIVTSSGGASHLPHNYTIFGRVLAGMDIVRAIERTPRNGSTPVTPIKIVSMKATAK